MMNFDFPTVRDLLDDGARKFNNSTFLKYIENDIVVEKSFIEVRNDSLAFCRMIRSISTDKMHIALVGETSYEYFVSLIGILISGNVAVPLSPDISDDEAEILLRKADVNMLLYDELFSDKADSLRRVNGLKFLNIGDKSDFKGFLVKYSDESEYSSLSDFYVDKKECAAIIFTSGTTGNKNGVMLSTESIVGNIMYKDYYTDIFRENDISMSVLPMYHIYCFTGDFLKNLKDGLQVCINGNMRELLKNVRIFKPRVIRVVPMIAEFLLRRVKMFSDRHSELSKEECAAKVLGENLKYLISGGAYLEPEIISDFAEYGITVRQGYGMTEAGCRISVPDETVSGSSVGKVLDICEVKTDNGEILVKTPTVMLGYYKNKEVSDKLVTEDGWLKTGDLGYVTDDGELFVTGRVKNLIILSNGENVSPEAIEKKIMRNKLVSEVMVYAKNDKICAEIFPDCDYAIDNEIDNITLELNHFIDELNLSAKSSHFISDVLIRYSPLPKTDSGKIKRKYSL